MPHWLRLESSNSTIFVYDQALPVLAFSSSKCCKVTIITRRVESDRASSWRCDDPVHLHHKIAQSRCQHQSMREKERSTTFNDIRRDPSTWYLSCLCSSERGIWKTACGISPCAVLNRPFLQWVHKSYSVVLSHYPFSPSTLTLERQSIESERDSDDSFNVYWNLTWLFSCIAFASVDMLASSLEKEMFDWKD